MSFAKTLQARAEQLHCAGLVDAQIVDCLCDEFPLYRRRRIWRTYRGLTGAQLAERCSALVNKELASKNITLWEKFPEGDGKLSYGDLMALAEVLQTSPHTLVDDADLEHLLPVERAHLEAQRASEASDLAIESADQQSIETVISPFARKAAERSSQHAGKLLGRELDVVDVNELLARVRKISTRHLYVNSLELFRATYGLREEVYAALKASKGHMDRNDLYVLASTLSCLLSDTCISAGEYAAANTIARSARSYADMAGHNELKIWSQAKLQAIVSRHENDPSRSIQLAEACSGFASTRLMLVQFHNAMANYCAYAGHVDEAQLHLEQARDAKDGPETSEFLTHEVGGMFAYPDEKEAEVLSGVLLKLSDFSGAEEQGLKALKLYERNPAERRAFGNESLARINVATARLRRDCSIEGADEILEPVFSLPAAKRQTWFLRPLVEVANDLEKPELQSTEGRNLADRILQFSGETSVDHAAKYEVG